MKTFSAALNALRTTARSGHGRKQSCLRTEINRLHRRGLRLEQLEERALLSVDPVVQANPVWNVAIDSPIVIQQGSNALMKAAASLPTSYDLRNVSGSNYVTSVKNQGSWGTCWTFATYGSLESSILKAGGATNDFSERNLAYLHGFDLGPDDGGNSHMSEAYLSRFSGPIKESDDPYGNMGTADSVTGPVQDYVREMLRFSGDSEMKTALMTYGALYTSMNWNDANYRQSDYTYYCTSATGTSHAVTIVGWDDTKVTAGGTGAWLIKNSWGTSWLSWGGMSNANGYFWLSYQDAVGGNTGESFNSAVPASNYSKVYDWANFGDVSQLNTPYGMNAYTASSNSSLKSVGFFTEAEGAAYTVSVYDTYSNGVLSDLLGTATGTEAFAGYHTVDLASAVPLASGNDFYVCLHITGGGDYPMAFDAAVADWSSACTASAGQSYYSFNGASWTDLTSYKATANFAINALVQDMSASPTAVALAAVSDSGMSSTDRVTNLDNSAPSKTLQFVVSGTASGATVTVYAGGVAIGSAVASGASTTVTTTGAYDLVDGAHSITARQTESGKSESADSSSVIVGVDTTLPTCTTPDLVSLSDTGASSTDNLTQAYGPEFNGTAADPQINGYMSGIWKVLVNSDDGRSSTDSTSPFYDVFLATLSEGSRTVSATVYDIAGNAYTNPTALAVAVDRTSPTVTINQASGQADPTTALPIHFTAVFSEKVNGFTSADLTGAPAGAVVTVTPVGTTGTTFDVMIDAFTADTTFSLTVAADQATDDAGNENTASTSTDNTVTFQRLAPVATVALNASSPLTNDVLTATATKSSVYSDPVTLTYVWLVNGVEKRRVAGTAALTDTFDLSVAGNGDRGDVVTVQVTPTDGVRSGATAAASATVAAANVTGRYVFYNHSYYDGDNVAANAQDDSAIATNKTALLPGVKAAFANYTSYSRGINGIMVDVTGAATPITAADFEFKVGNSSDPSDSAKWTTAPTPTVTCRTLSAGVTRVTLIWADNAIQKKWLQVKVLATAGTGLASPDVFYFGNAIGESGDSTTNAYVNATDAVAAGSHTQVFTRAAVTNLYDYDRDGRVNATDAVIAGGNTAVLSTALQLITPLDNQRYVQLLMASLGSSSNTDEKSTLAAASALPSPTVTTSVAAYVAPAASTTAAVDAVFSNLGQQTVV